MLNPLVLSLTIVLWIAPNVQSLAFKATATHTATSLSTRFPETAGIQPIPCHSHNDYLRTHPLVDALSNGCISVEADIWQKNDMKDDLRVGHTEESLEDDRTLRKLYVDPIIQRLVAANGGKQLLSNLKNPWNGIFELDSNQTLVLLIDFKTSGDPTWSTLMNALSPLRDGGWLSYWDIQNQRFQRGPVTMVASGKSTLDEVVKTTFGNSTSSEKGYLLGRPPCRSWFQQSVQRHKFLLCFHGFLKSFERLENSRPDYYG